MGLGSSFGITSETNNNIQTDGLVYYLDAAYKKSYPRSGTTWSDLAISGSSPASGSTLLNGPTFSTDGGGSISFDGSNDAASAHATHQPLINASNSTLYSWVYIDGSHSGEFRPVVIHKSTGFSRWGLGWGNSGTKFYVSYFTSDNHARLHSSNGFAVGSWYNVVTTKNAATVKIYVNAVLEGTATDQNTSDLTLTAGANTTIAYNNYPSDASGQHYLKGKISNMLFYDKTLSAGEVLQNYNAQKQRFGV